MRLSVGDYVTMYEPFHNDGAATVTRVSPR